MKNEQQYPEPTVGALIFNENDQLLIVKTHKWRGNYTIPGGHVELGEQLVDALEREIKEETGLSLSGAEFLCVQEFIYDERPWLVLTYNPVIQAYRSDKFTGFYLPAGSLLEVYSLLQVQPVE